VKLNLDQPSGSSNLAQCFFEIPGILLEYIDGFTLSKIEQKVPRVFWQQICDMAIQVVNIVCDHNILNEDVRPDNMIVRANKGSSNGYEVLMIDFALSRLRRSDETDDEWRRAKWSQDEEGAIGYVMQHRLKGEIKYQPSGRYVVYENVSTE
jgi:serine/threonine protein kinase